MSLLRKRNTGCHGEMFDTNATFYGLVNVVGNLVVTGNEFIGGALDAVGAVNFFSTLDVADTINAGANLGVTGDAFIGTNLDVTGTSRLRDTLQVEGATTLDASLGVFGASVLQSTLAVTGAGTFDNTLDVTGETTTGSLGVTGAGTVGGTFGVIGATTLFSTLGVTGAGTFDDTLDVTGAATTGSLGVTGAGTVGGTFGVTGATTLSSTLDVTGAATTGSLGVTDAGTVGGTFDVTGATTLSSTLDVAGKATLQDALDVDGEAKFNGDFEQAGPTAVTHHVDVTGEVSLKGDTSAVLRSDSSVSVNSLGSAKLHGDTSTTIGTTDGGETIVTGLVTTVTSPTGPVTVAAADDILTLNGSETNLTATTTLTIDCLDIDVPTASFYILTDVLIGYEFTPTGCYTGVLPWYGPWVPSIPPADVPAGGSVDDGFGYYDDGTNTATGQSSLRVHRGAGFTDVMLYGDNFVDLAVQSSEPTGQDGRFYIDDGSNASSALPSLRYYADSQWFSAAPYVQGSFTPILRIGGTIQSLSDGDGYYMRIGNMVTVAVHVVWTTSTGTGDLSVSIPFNTIGTAAISTYAIQGGQFQNISVGGGSPLTEAFQFALRRTTTPDRFDLVYFEPTRPVSSYQNFVSNLTDVNLNSGVKVIGFSVSYLATSVSFP